jgi:hypothetical protein
MKLLSLRHRAAGTGYRSNSTIIARALYVTRGWRGADRAINNAGTLSL